MHLTVRDAAKLLRTPEKQIYRWVEEGELPYIRVNEQPRFNRTELLEWATAKRLPISVELFHDDEDRHKALPTLVEALEADGLHYQVGGTDRASVLRAVLGVMRLPAELDQETLVEVLLAREALGSTGVGDGIAIPHVRQPIAVHGASVSLALCFLEKPVDFGAPDGKPVHALFVIISPTIRGHLQLLARLSAALHDPGFKAAVVRRAPAAELLAAAHRVEASFPRHGTGTR
ncbi:MAG: PTS sugar transporter subunit IIA [Myxococcaceae bacterium]